MSKRKIIALYIDSFFIAMLCAFVQSLLNIKNVVFFTFENNTTQHHYIVILFQEDLSYSIFAPNSMYDYQEEFKEFKKANHWNVKC